MRISDHRGNMQSPPSPRSERNPKNRNPNSDCDFRITIYPPAIPYPTSSFRQKRALSFCGSAVRRRRTCKESASGSFGYDIKDSHLRQHQRKFIAQCIILDARNEPFHSRRICPGIKCLILFPTLPTNRPYAKRNHPLRIASYISNACTFISESRRRWEPLFKNIPRTISARISFAVRVIPV